MFQPQDYEMAARLLLAFVLSGVIGYERERGGRPAGLRTHILVGSGAALIMLISIYGFEDVVSDNKDPGRLAAQVVSGIGFLGAGTIMRDGMSIQGLTTAASLWLVAAIGLATGAGMFKIAMFTTLLAITTLVTLQRIDRNMLERVRFNATILIKAKKIDSIIMKIVPFMHKKGVGVKNVTIEGGIEKSIFVEFATADIDEHRLNLLMEEIKTMDEVTSVELYSLH